MLHSHRDFCWIPRKVRVFCRVHEAAEESFPLFYPVEERSHELSFCTGFVMERRSLYNCVLVKALAEGTWNYHIVRLAGNPAE